MAKKFSRPLFLVEQVRQLFRRWGLRARVARSCRPRIEVVEVRVMPATNTWVGAATGDWATGGNWSSGSAPISTDDVVISGNVTVQHTSSSDTVSTVTVGSGATLQITGGSSITAQASSGPQVTDSGTIDLGDSSTAGNLFVDAGSGSITITSTTVTALGAVTVSGGTLSFNAGTTLPALGAVTVSPNSQNAVLNFNTGSTTWQNTGASIT